MSTVLTYRVPKGKYWKVQYVDDLEQAHKCGLKSHMEWCLGKGYSFSVVTNRPFQAPSVQSSKTPFKE